MKIWSWTKRPHEGRAWHMVRERHGHSEEGEVGMVFVMVFALGQKNGKDLIRCRIR